MAEAQISKSRIAVIGAGISGLTAAKRLADAGYAVDVYEASGRTGGMIETVDLNGARVEARAEFVDSTHIGLIALCKELGVGLVPAADQDTVRFHSPDGRMISNEDFLRAIRPLQEKIIQDKSIIARDPNGERAQHLNAISFAQYLEEISGQPVKENASDPSLWERMKQYASSFGPGKTDPAMLQILLGSYTSETGRTAKDINALQFVSESSAIPQNLLASDCAWRIEGGTEQLTIALRKYLESKGVTFHMHAEATGVTRHEDGTFGIAFSNVPESPPYDNLVLAMPAYSLAKLSGLEHIGFSGEEVDTLRNAQYMHGIKFTVKTRRPVARETTFSSDGFQIWSSSPDTVTFLVGGEAVDRLKGRALVEDCLKKYARANNTDAQALFDKRQIVYLDPASKPCYASPAPGQALMLGKLAAAQERLADNGVGLTGSFLPCSANDRSFGFMENGVQSAEHAVALLNARHQERQQFPQPGFVEREEQRARTRSQAPTTTITITISR